MKREIKFRAWDGEKMRYPALIDIRDKIILNHYTVYCVDEQMPLYFYCDEIMQYTGIKDKNGKEIYEGDIVKMIYKEDDGGGWYTKTPIEKGIVYFDPFWGVKFDCRNNTQRISEHWKSIRLRTMQDVEVIGNIYENPELLK